MNVQHIARFYNAVQETAIRIANLYAKIRQEKFPNLAKKQPMRCSFDTLEDIDASTFTCYYEYNDSCHCHPKYVKERFNFSTELLAIALPYVLDENNCTNVEYIPELLAAINKSLEQEGQSLEERLARERAEKIAQEKRDEERRRIEKEKRDLAEFKRLSAKFAQPQ